MFRRSREKTDPLTVHTLQLLAARRFELYASIAPLLADLEEAIDEKNVRKIIEVFASIHRRMRESLAYLNRRIYRSLRVMQRAMETGDDSTGGLDLAGLRIASIDLHVEMSRALRQPEFEPVERILDVDAGMRAYLGRAISSGPASTLDHRMGVALKFSEKGWTLISRHKYSAAAKQFRKALSQIPGEPTIRTDLGYSLLLAGDTTGAVAELTLAHKTLAEGPGYPGSRQRAARFLGRARRAVAEEKFRKRQVEEAIAILRDAIKDLEESLRGEVEEEEKATVHTEVEASRQRLAQWEEIWAKVSSLVN